MRIGKPGVGVWGDEAGFSLEPTVLGLEQKVEQFARAAVTKYRRPRGLRSGYFSHSSGSGVAGLVSLLRATFSGVLTWSFLCVSIPGAAFLTRHQSDCIRVLTSLDWILKPLSRPDLQTQLHSEVPRGLGIQHMNLGGTQLSP